MTGPRRLSDGRRPLRVPTSAGTSSRGSVLPEPPRDDDEDDERTDVVGTDYGAAAASGRDAVTDRYEIPTGTPDPAADLVDDDRSAVRFERRSIGPSRDGGAERENAARDDEPGDGEPPDWLLGPADDESGRLAVAPDAVTEAIPHGRSAQRRARRRRTLWVGVAAVLVVALVGGLLIARNLFGLFFPPDYDGAGTGRVVVQVADGASMREVGEDLVRSDVVASARGFGSAAEDDPNGRGIQPGFYELRHRMSARAAVAELLDPAARLGRADIRSGTQLDDTAGVGGSTVPGVLAQIARATCAPDPVGAERCVAVDDLRRAMATTDPAALGVPDWAIDGVRRADPDRRLEGLVAPGPYDIPPGSDAPAALAAVMRTSEPRLEATGLVGEAERQHRSPYEVLVVASLAEKEGVAGDFGKVARVIDNRLALPMRLQFDSTINYPLDKQRLLTQPVDRARPGPYNSYLNLGLPPTPIGSVSNLALSSALDPTPGPWVYFVKCQPQGESCFAVTPSEHDANRRLAQQRGVY